MHIKISWNMKDVEQCKKTQPGESSYRRRTSLLRSFSCNTTASYFCPTFEKTKLCCVLKLNYDRFYALWDKGFTTNEQASANYLKRLKKESPEGGGKFIVVMVNSDPYPFRIMMWLKEREVKMRYSSVWKECSTVLVAHQYKF